MPGNVWKVFLVRGFFWLHFFSAVLVPFLTETGGLSLSQVFALNAWFMLCCSVFEAPTGALADMFGRRLTLAAGGAVAVLAALLYVRWPGLWGFALAETVFAAAYTLQSGADEALLYDTLKADGREADAGRLLARLESFKLGAILVGGLAGSVIAAWWGISAPMKAYALAGAASFLLSLSLEEPPGENRHEHPGLFSVLREGWAELSSKPALMELSLEFAASNALAWSIIWLYQPLLKAAGVPMAWFGTVHAASALAQAAALTALGSFDPARGRRLLDWAGALAAASFALLAVARPVPVLAVFIVLAFTFGLARGPIFASLMNPLIPSSRRATVLSLAAVLRTIAIVVVNPVVGWTADRSLPAACLGVGAGLAAVGIWRWSRRRQIA